MGFENLSGRTFGQYELRDLMGVGGMGAVYRAYQSGLDREVAVKVLPRALAAESGYIERFIREARTAALLEHPHIVRIYDYGTQGDISYLVMALLRGGSLSQRLSQSEEIKRTRASLGEVAVMLNQIGSALDYAHHEGVLHRDIKPANIMFDNQGRAYLTDFGIAKLMGATTALTGTGVAMGSPSYMPPEQWAGQDLGPAADQYALGVTIYQTIAGRLPFEADSAAQLMYKHFHEEPTPLSVTRSDIPTALMIVLNRAMAKSPDARFPNITQFAQALESAIEGNMGEPTGFFQYKLKPDRPRPSGANPTPFAAEVPRTPSNIGNSVPPASGEYQMTNPPTQPGSGGYQQPPSGGYTPQSGGYMPSGGYTPGQTPPGQFPPGQTPSGIYPPGQTPSGGYTMGYTQQAPRPFYRSPVALIGGVVVLIALGLLAAIAFRPNENSTDAVFLTLTGVQVQAATNAQATVIAAAAVATETPEPTAGETSEPTATETGLPTGAPTDEPTPTPTEEPSLEPTESVLAVTETPEPSATPTETATATDTPTATETATDAPTDTPTERPTNTATFTPSHTPTETHTNTPEFTPTFTFTPRPTNTPTEPATNTPEPLAAASMAFGESVTESIDDSAPEILFEFAGAAGDVVNITVEATSGNLDPSLALFGPTGEEVASNDDISGTDRNAALSQIALPEDGTYTIRVQRYRGPRGNSEGEFELSLLSQSGVDIVWDEPVTGEISDEVWKHEYQFEGAANQVVTISLWATDDTLDTLLRILNPDGSILAENDDATVGISDSEISGQTLWQDGTYTIVATRFREAQGNSTGTFELLLTEGAGSNVLCTGGTLAIGCPAYVSEIIDRAVNVRTEPRAGGTVVTSAAAGTPVTIIDGPRAAEGFIWWQVRLDDGSEGWMVARIGFSDVLMPGSQ